MSMNFGEQPPFEPPTVRGRNWPCLRQFNVFLENRVGRLHELLRHLEGYEVRVLALSIVDSVDCAIARLVLNNYERGQERFRLSNFTVFETDVIGVELPESSQPYIEVCTALMQAEVNIHYTYPLMYRRHGHPVIALYVDSIDQALKTLSDKGLKIVTENDLLLDDEY